MFRRFRMAVCAGLALVAPARAADGLVTISVTEHGIPHISAANYGGLGYGLGYATAKLDICGLAEAFATFNGTRAADFGESGMDEIGFIGAPIDNVSSDQVMRLIVADADVDAQWRIFPAQLRALIRGYAEGYDRYIAATAAAALPKACRGAAWVRAITYREVTKRILALRLAAGLDRQHLALLAAASPASPGAAPAPSGKRASIQRDELLSELGSNGLAAGRDATENGSGLLFGNPHWFWEGPNRFIEVHLTIPGELDVMGASLLGMPVVVIGFNQTLAWTHTSSTDVKGTVFRLNLAPGKPTTYLIDGKPHAMTRRSISVNARGADGKLTEHRRDFWMTSLGPVIASDQFPWDGRFAYVFSDVNAANYRTVQQWLAIAKSRNVHELLDGLKTILGGAWNNTIAADSGGEALYADMTTAPGVDAETLRTCQLPGFEAVKQFRTTRFTIFEGSSSRCHWSSHGAAPQRGIVPADKRPSLIRTDFVANSNYSHWASNPKQLLSGFSPMIGFEDYPLNFRTRAGIVQIEDRLAGRDGLSGNRLSIGAIERIHDSARDLFAELAADDLVAACKRNPAAMAQSGRLFDLSQACAVLEKWDRRAGADSVGYALFREFTANIAAGDDAIAWPGLWRVPFDKTDPIHTPRGFDADRPEVLRALASAADYLENMGVPIDAPWGQVQFVTRKDRKLPIHGGFQLWDNIVFPLVAKVGYTDLPNYMNGNSFEFAVSFSANGPAAEAVSASSQAPDDPDSPYYADQTEMYARGEWMRLPFRADEIDAKRVEPPIALRVPAALARPD